MCGGLRLWRECPGLENVDEPSGRRDGQLRARQANRAREQIAAPVPVVFALIARGPCGKLVNLGEPMIIRICRLFLMASLKLICARTCSIFLTHLQGVGRFRTAASGRALSSRPR